MAYWFLELLLTALATHPVLTDKETSIVQNGCFEGSFQCENHELCIPQNKICDKKADCPDGSDEVDCDDQHDDAFWDAQFIKRTGAEHDDIKGNGCLLLYNGSCNCTNRNLFCEYRNLQKAPDDLPHGNSSIFLLDFTGNNFMELTQDSVKTIPNNVENIVFVHCNISEIRPETFYGLTGTRELHLDNNFLKVFPSEVFAADSNMTDLFLMYNQISKIHPEAFKNVSGLIKLDLRGNRLTKIDGTFLEPLSHLRYLFLQNNLIKHIRPTSFPRLSLESLSLVENQIVSFENGSFANLTQLRRLYLSNNQIKKLVNGVFSNLTDLEALTLNDNLIHTIEDDVFKDIASLRSLNLERNEFRSLDGRPFRHLTNLQALYFDRFELCSSALHVRNCFPKGDGISDHEHMLANPVLRICVWVMGAIGCTGNIIVLLGRHFAPTNNVVHSLYLRNLALSDLLMGVYLFIIAGADHHYRGVYGTYQLKWRNSTTCMICGFLSTLSCESSVLILTLVTWDRFVSVTQPLARKQPSKKTATVTLLLLWCLAIIVSILPISFFTKNYFGDKFYGNNGVCLSLHIHDPYAMGWEYSAVMFILINTLALIFICYAYLRMINEIRASGVACRSTRQSQDRDKVAQRFGIIVLTDCLCWVPVILVKLVALYGTPIHQDLYAWLAIFILPINSALNPVLYTLTTTIFKKQMTKMMNSCCPRKKKDNQHTASESGFSLSFGVFPIGSTKRIFSYRGTHTSSLTGSKNSWRKSTAV